ncbi:DUF6221 family protein [Arthrobacter globiformis]|uniref:DUF6221 family protein n=1 Tax=Arthrobacter globiformis TaxID=1665 RepID=UPI00277E063A|nr:DUF6221 family protein [Arthrobacter globiformis]MDQ0863763.1 hypothetical protein [Arthrobacter globiformis]
MSRGDQNQRFTERYSELKEFIEQTGRRPRAESKDAAEAALGRWTTAQQTLRNAGQLSADRLELLEDLGDALAPRQTYADRIAELADFIRDNGRRPLYGSANAPERSLAAWLNFQVIARNKGELSAERSDLLEPLVPLDSTRRIRPIAEWVAELMAFHDEHGRMPLSTREEERGLALWLINKRMSFKDGTMPQDQIDALSTVPGALATRKNVDPDVRLLEAQEWCAQHGYIPRTSFTDTDALSAEEEQERTIGAWMRNHARESDRSYEPSAYSERRQSILDLYDKYPSRMEFNEIVTREKVRAALECADHLPSSTEDSQIHGWIANARRQRAAGTELPPETLEVLALADSLKPHSEHKRNARLDELRAFVEANRRMPGFAKLASKEEKNLAFWVKRRLDGSRTTGSADINEQINKLAAECGRIAAAADEVRPVEKTQASRARESAEAANVMAALNAAGHLPGSASPIYSWLAKHRKLRSAGTLISDEVARVLAYADTLKSAREIRHERRLVEYKDFIARCGRLPAPGGEKAEASLANWASGVLRGVVNAGPDIESALCRLASDSTRQTGRDLGGTSNDWRHGWEMVLDAYARGERLASLYEDDEQPERFFDRLRETITAKHEQSRADAIAGEISSLRQLIQDDMDRGRVRGHPSPEFMRRAMALDHGSHWQHDLAIDVYQEICWEAEITADYPMTCYSPYLDYGILAVYGMLNGLTADSVQPDSPDEEIVVEDLERFLSDFSASSRQRTVKAVLGALRQLSHAPGRQLYAAKYDWGREQLRETCEVPSYLDWPAPVQTVSQLLGKGSWNGAMVAMGLPKILQSLNWQGSDFISAAVEFAKTLSEQEHAPATDFAYDDWVKLQVVRGTERPSLLSMQAEFGTVEAALRLVGGSVDLTHEDTDAFDDEWHRVHELLAETVSRLPADATLDVRVVEEGEALDVPLFASAAITVDGADCSLASALVVGTEHWPQDVKRMLELGWSSSEDRRDVWVKMSVPRADVASTLVSGLRECRGVTKPQQLRWSDESRDGETPMDYGIENASHGEGQDPVAGSNQDLLWANAVQALTDELVWLKDDDFLSIAYNDGTSQDCAPYAQATPDDSGLSLELVSEQFLSAEVWPLNPGFLLAAGWKAPSDENPNWHMVDVPRESAAKKLLDGLRLGRECQDAEQLRWHLAVFAPQVDRLDDLDDEEGDKEAPSHIATPDGGHDDSLRTTQSPESEWQNENMNDIIEFLKDRIAEDELEAQRVAELIPGEVYWKAFLMEAWAAHSEGGRGADRAFKYMRKLGPDHIMAQCEAKRKIIAQFEHIARGSEPSGDQHLEKLLFILAEPYAAHHGYREQWRL